MPETMKAIAAKGKYGSAQDLISIEVPKPTPGDDDVLVQVKASSVNPIDIKARSKVYDDFPDYYDHVPKDEYQIFGYDGSGIISAVGSKVTNFKPGDEIYYSGSPIRHGSNAEYQLVAAASVALKARSLDFVQSACMPLTWVTAYEALIERMEIRKGEEAAILIVNGAGGVGSVASQIARTLLRLPVVITTTSRQETTAFSKSMGATHTVNHREDVPSQIAKLDLKVPLKYIFLTHSTANYLAPAVAACAPFGKICSIVQTKEFPQYGTEMMAKSLTFVWALIGTKPWYGVDVESHGRILKELARLLDDGDVKCHHQTTFPLTVEGLRKAHETIESGGSIGKVGLGVDVEGVGGKSFA